MFSNEHTAYTINVAGYDADKKLMKTATVTVKATDKKLDKLNDYEYNGKTYNRYGYTLTVNKNFSDVKYVRVRVKPVGGSYSTYDDFVQVKHHIYEKVRPMPNTIR